MGWKVGREENLTRTCADYLRFAYPWAFFFHVANERKTSPAYYNLLKQMGVRKGIPDLIICEAAGKFHGLAIELKVGYNKPTPSQKNCMVDLSNRGWSVAVCRSLDEFQKIVDPYLRHVETHNKISTL